MEAVRKNSIISARHILKIIECQVKKVLRGYSQIFFSQNWFVGFLFCLATFIVPLQGLAGLSGLLLSNLFAVILGLSREHIEEGYFAFNGLLISLALGLTYRVNSEFILMIIIASFLGVIIGATIRSMSEKFFHVPVLSTPFVITTWIVIAAGQKFNGLIYTTAPFEITLLQDVLPQSIEYAFRSLGAAFFQLNVPSGIIIALGILLFSRQAFLIALGSIFLGSYIHTFLGGSGTDLTGHWIAFNFALTGIAIGGMYIVPGIGSYLLAFGGAILSAIISAGMAIILTPLGLPILAFPFLITTQLIIFALRNRISPKYLNTITVPKETPEKNLKFFKNKRARFLSDEIPAFELPLSGEWTVTQGWNGEHTHKGLWAHGWDFEVTGSDMKSFQNDGLNHEDYFAWQMPVFSPGDGKVIRVINHIEDNGIGQINSKQNWGNTIIIWHYGSVYTSLSHFAKGSISVVEGEVVRRGQPIGRIGNSGRSPYPHLHYQVQYSPELGAQTAKSELLNYIVKNNSAWHYMTHGVPEKSSIISPIEVNTSIAETITLPQGTNWEYAIIRNNQSWTETWKTEVDFLGNRYLVCKDRKSKTQIYNSNKAFMQLNYEGKKWAGLLWFFMAVPRMPFTEQNIQWYEEMPGDLLLNPFTRLIFDFIEPIFTPAKLKSDSRLTYNGNGKYTVHTNLWPKGLFYRKKRDPITLTSVFEKNRGLVHLNVIENNRPLIQMNLTRAYHENNK